MKHFISILCVLMFIQSNMAQDLSNLRGAQPFRVSGSIGTNNTFYNSSNPYQMRSPVSNAVFANLNISLYGMQIPLAFHFSNNNSNFSHPFARFGMSPRYKALQLHVGYRSMNFSPYTYSNLSFLGAGVDFNWRLLRFAVFTGSLNQASNRDPLQESAMRPMTYQRQAYGFKLGIGNARNYFDLIIFNARDDTLSISPAMGSYLQPKENLIAGTSFRFSLGRSVSVSSNVAASAYTGNMRSSAIEAPDLDFLEGFYTPRFGSVIRLAGDVRANINLGRAYTMLQYKLIQPEFHSLGTPYLTNNIQQMGVNLNAPLFNNKLSTNISLYYQEDNVTKTQLYTNTGTVMTFNANAQLSKKLMLTASYNGFNQRQKDGTIEVNDSVRINRIMHNVTLIPTYTFMDAAERSHSINVNFNNSINKNQNKFISDASETNTLMAGIGYNIAFSAMKTNLMINYNYQQSSSSFYNFNSNNVALSGGKRFLKEENLNVQLHSNFGYGQINHNTRNLSVMAGISSSFTYRKNHTASLRFNFNHMNNYNLDGLYNIHGFDTMVSVGYTYRFTPAMRRTAEPG